MMTKQYDQWWWIIMMAIHITRSSSPSLATGCGSTGACVQPARGPDPICSSERDAMGHGSKSHVFRCISWYSQGGYTRSQGLMIPWISKPAAAARWCTELISICIPLPHGQQGPWLCSIPNSRANWLTFMCSCHPTGLTWFKWSPNFLLTCWWQIKHKTFTSLKC